jgi:hypothetical protein
VFVFRNRLWRAVRLRRISPPVLFWIPWKKPQKRPFLAAVGALPIVPTRKHVLIRQSPYHFWENGELGKQSASLHLRDACNMIPTVESRPAQGLSQVRSGAFEMKSVSPWFQTAQLLNGIRKTVSEIEANRTAPPDRNVRNADSQRADSKKSH